MKADVRERISAFTRPFQRYYAMAAGENRSGSVAARGQVRNCQRAEVSPSERVATRRGPGASAVGEESASGASAERVVGELPRRFAAAVAGARLCAPHCSRAV